MTFLALQPKNFRPVSNVSSKQQTVASDVVTEENSKLTHVYKLNTAIIVTGQFYKQRAVALG